MVSYTVSCRIRLAKYIRSNILHCIVSYLVVADLRTFYNNCVMYTFTYITLIQIILIIIIIIKAIVPSRSIGCLWVFSTSVYQLPRTLVYSSFYPLPWLLIFSSHFSVFLSSCFLEDSSVGQPLVFLHPVFLMCDVDPDIGLYYHLFIHNIKLIKGFGRTGPCVITECSIMGF